MLFLVVRCTHRVASGSLRAAKPEGRMGVRLLARSDGSQSLRSIAQKAPPERGFRDLIAQREGLADAWSHQKLSNICQMYIAP